MAAPRLQRKIRQAEGLNVELIKNKGFEGGHPARPAEIEISLVDSVVGLTQVLEETLRGETSLKKISKTVGRALAQAQAGAQKIAEQKKRLAFMERLAVNAGTAGVLTGGDGRKITAH